MKKALAWLLFFLLACQGASEENGQGRISIIDDLGYKAAVPQQPMRIISTALFLDDFILNIVPANRIAGLSLLVDDREQSLSADKAKLVKTPRYSMSRNIELIAVAAPDLVLAATWANPEAVARLRSFGIGVYQVKPPVTLRDVRNLALRLGRLLNSEAQAESLAENIRAANRRIVLRRESVLENNRKSILEYNNLGFAGGKGTSWDYVVSKAGLRNAAAGLANANQWGYAPISKEVFIALNPDWIYTNESGSQELLVNPAYAKMNAVRTKHFIVLKRADSIALTSASPYLAQGIEALQSYIYESAF